MDWWSGTFKGLIGTAIGASATYAWKKAKPFYLSALKFLKVLDRLDAFDLRIGVLENKQASVLHIDKEPTFIYNKKGEFTYVNPAFLEMTGMVVKSDAFGMGWLSAIPIEDMEKVEKQIQRLLEHPSSFSLKMRWLHIPTGKIIDTICRSEVVRDKGDNVVETVGRLDILKN